MKGQPTVAILGGGQLARMMCAAATRLGVRTRVYQAAETGPCAFVRDVVTGAWDDVDALRAFLAPADVVTLDYEAVDLTTVRACLPEGVEIRPGPQTMEWVADKVLQRQRAVAAGLPVGPTAVCRTVEELQAAGERLGYPLMLKRPRNSYDGYGNHTAKSKEGLADAHAALGGGEILAEGWVPFELELATMVARRPGGETAVYPVVATYQKDHRCDVVEVPAAVSEDVAARARALALRAAEVYGCVGVVGVEMFLLPDGEVWLNEIAPRPHNTGHYTLDACATSQFENHLRAVLDLPLGDSSLLGPAAAMVNVIGTRTGPTENLGLDRALAVTGASVHLYGKRDVRPGRKMGHVTALGPDVATARARARQAAKELER
ncbi:MAG: 5-(carboxyamino)imidazole ribonucleotide synthase [Nannocystaceae bacterium]|nr:5-(carboxyamino)imidazole ribonucleotide synthase [Nannocystaceae bacterium]